jgi:formylglycine-generating enzyme required for sulfatase activity
VSCPDTGNGCTGHYAVSLAGVTPAAFINWFQAAAACRNSGKRLATNQEWQAAAFGTPDPGTDNGIGDCNVNSVFATTLAGARASCESDVGAFDMVGNLYEWVADWGDVASGCDTWSPAFGGDITCMGGAGTINFPGALLRGGFWALGSNVGVFVVDGGLDPSNADSDIGFRCAR